MAHPEPDELALAALPAESPPPDVAAHLAECARCREEVAALTRTVELARAGEGLRATPPPRVWEGIAAELGLGPDPSLDGTGTPARAAEALTPAPAGPPDDTVTPLRPARSRPLWRRFAVPAAASVAGVLVGLGLGAAIWPSEPDTGRPVASAPLAPLPATAPGVQGEVRLVADGTGRELIVDVTDPGGAPADGYLEAWLLGDGATRLFSLGTLIPQGGRFTGTFRLPDDLPLEQFDTVDVSVEHFDGNPGHSGDSLLRGRL